jgi:hypothetical protein
VRLFSDQRLIGWLPVGGLKRQQRLGQPDRHRSALENNAVIGGDGQAGVQADGAVIGPDRMGGGCASSIS